MFEVRIFILVIILYILLVLLMYWWARSLTGYNKREMWDWLLKSYPVKNLYTKDITKEYFYLTSDDIEIKLRIYYKGETPPKEVYLFHSGVKAGHRSGFKYFSHLIDKGYLCVSYDSRGWGDLFKKSKCTYGFKEKDDLNNVINFLHNKYEINNLILHGESMGGATVVEYINKYGDEQIDRLIVDSGVASYKEVFEFQLYKTMPMWLVQLTTKVFGKFSKLIDKYNPFEIQPYKNIDENIKLPIMFIHSKEDDVVPIDQLYLYKNKLNNNENIKFVIFSCGEHCNEILDNEENYLSHLDDFIK